MLSLSTQHTGKGDQGRCAGLCRTGGGKPPIRRRRRVEIVTLKFRDFAAGHRTIGGIGRQRFLGLIKDGSDGI